MRPKIRRMTWSREIGTALAVAAIWLLSLLAPLHHASNLGRDLAARGYEPAALWSLCDPTGSAAKGEQQAVFVCPAQGIGKSDVLLPTVETAPAVFLPILALLLIGAWRRPGLALAPYRLPRARAPPL